MSFVTDGNRLAGYLVGIGNMPTFNGLSNCSDDFMKRLRVSCFILHTTFPSPGTFLTHLIWGWVLLPLVIHISVVYQKGWGQTVVTNFWSPFSVHSQRITKEHSYTEISFCLSYISILPPSQSEKIYMIQQYKK